MIEPPEPLTLTFVGRRTLKRVEATSPDGAVYQTAGKPQYRLVLARKGDGWEVVEGKPEPGWLLYRRAAQGAAAEPFEPGLATELPAVIELVKVEQRETTFR